MLKGTQAMLRAFAAVAGLLLGVMNVENASAEEAAAEAAAPAKKKQSSTVTVSGLEWRTDYNAAYQAAKQGKRMLLINMTGAGSQQEGSIATWISRTCTIDWSGSSGCVCRLMRRSSSTERRSGC